MEGKGVWKTFTVLHKIFNSRYKRDFRFTVLKSIKCYTLVKHTQIRFTIWFYLEIRTVDLAQLGHLFSSTQDDKGIQVHKKHLWLKKIKNLSMNFLLFSIKFYNKTDFCSKKQKCVCFIMKQGQKLSIRK